MQSSCRILYAGDGDFRGAACYLLAVLRSLKATVIHLTPARELRSQILRRRFDAILLSDYPHARLSSKAEQLLVEQVRTGTGLLMIGGWGSFSGPWGGWKNSRVEKILPVRCRRGDDRLNLPGGGHLHRLSDHPMLRGLPFHDPPVIVGVNQFLPKSSAEVIIGVRRVMPGNRPKYDSVVHPVLVIDKDPEKRVAALAADLAPHWCGGLVDWGQPAVQLPVKGRQSVQVGAAYLRFVSAIIRWLTRQY